MKKTFYLFLTFLLCFVLMGNVKAVEKPVTPTIFNSNIEYAYGNYDYTIEVDVEDYLTPEQTYTVDGFELYYVEEFCKNTNTCEEVLVGGYDISGAASVRLNLGETAKVVARVYVLDQSNERIYSDYSNELALSNVNLSAPALSIPSGGPTDYNNNLYLFELGINSSDYLIPGSDDSYLVDGYELCEKKDQGSDVCTKHYIGDAISLTVSGNVTKKYYAKVYIQLSEDDENDIAYSDASNELTIDTRIKIPVFSNGHYDPENPGSDYSKPFVSYEKGKYLYNLKIDTAKYKIPGTGETEDPEDVVRYFIDGYEVCEVGKDDCTSYEVGVDADVYILAGSLVNLHARAFTGEGENRVYSAWSNELTFDTTIAAPLFDEEADNVQFTNGKYVYTKAIQFDKYKYLDENEELQYFVDGYEFCEKDGICARHDLEEEVTISMNPGETKSYFVRAYTQDATEKRAYSAGTDLTIENNNISIEDVVADFNNGEIIEIFNSLGASLGARAEGNKVITYGVDENDQTVDVLAFTFDENSINYSDLESEITEEKAIMSLSSEIMVLQMIESVFSAAGYNGYMITDDTIFGENDSYETKGLLLKSEEFELSSGTEEEGRSVISGTYLRQFKMSTNKNVIANIVKNYAEEMSKEITEAPKVKVSKGNNNSLVLTWAEDRHADGYKVYRSESKNGKYKKIATVTEGTYTDKKLTYGKTYYYKVKAYNAESGKTSSIVYKKVTPNKVENLSGKPSGSTKVKLSWDKVSATGYEVYRSTDNKKWSRIVTLTTSKSVTYTNKYLKSNKKYYYKVRAYKTVNGRRVYGKYSEVVLVKTAPTKPKITVSNSSYDSLKVKVASVSGGKTYKIYRSTSLKGTFTEVGSLTEAGTYKDTGLKTGKTYYYKVKACNSDGKCGSYSSIVSKKVIPGKAKFELTLGENKEVTVSVTEMEGSTGYAIYRSKYKNYGWTKVKNLTSGTEFSETLKKGTYYYKVRTYRTVNGTKVYGKYADVKSIKVK